MIAPLAIIAEDEPLLRGEIREMLCLLWPELRICAEVADGRQAVEALEQFGPNVLFLDIQMPGLNGIEVARQASGRAHVVFITAYDNYAVDAFRDGALDYIVKPISPERMKVTIERLRSRLREPPADLTGLVDMLKSAIGGDSRYLKWLTVPHGTELRVLAVSEISYLRADNKYTTVNTRSSSFLLNSSLKEMQTKLDPNAFWQIHRGVVVNVSAIETIYRSMRGTLELKLKDRTELLPVSASHAHLFKHS
jgi:DNA-binding LytR/AlgR family response regulator